MRAGRAEELVAELQSRPQSGATARYMLGLVYAARSTGSERAALDACAELEAAIALRPLEAELHYRFGLALLALKRPQEAIDALRRAIELEPKRSAPYLPLAKALHQAGKTGEAVTALGQWADRRPPEAELASAKRLMEELVPPFAEMPKSAEPGLLRAAALLRERDDPLAAIPLLEQLSREHPRAAIAHALLAFCHRRLDDAARAIDELRRAVALAPLDGRNHQYLGEVYLERKQPAQARSAFARAIELNPLLEQAHLALGDLALEESDLQAARRHLAIAASLAPSIEVRAKLAAVLELSGEHADAIEELRAIHRVQPENPEWALRLGLLHLRRHRHSTAPEGRAGSKAEAIRWLREVLRLQSDNVTAVTALRSLDGS